MITSSIKRNFLLWVVLIETICVTYALKITQLIPVATIVYFFSGIAIPLVMVCLPMKTYKPFHFLESAKEKAWYKLLIIAMVGINIRYFTANWIKSTPLSYFDSDILPIIKVMCQRFLNGEWSSVYQPIPEIWNGIQPIYLPAMWVPFVVAVAGNFDLRWITAGSLFMSLSFIWVLWKPVKKDLMGAALLAATCMISWWLLTEQTHNFIRLSEEGVVVLYYCLLVLCLCTENYVLVGIAAALCAFSRFMLAGWYPAMMIYLLFIRKQPGKLLIFIGISLLALLLWVVLPFGWKPLHISINLPNQYIAQAERVWKESPQYFTKSMGFAKFFGSTHIRLQHSILILSALIVPALFMLGCLGWEKRKGKKLNNIPLACLKLSIVMVCTFIDIPYQYLFYTSTFISLLITTVLLAENEKNDS